MHPFYLLFQKKLIKTDIKDLTANVKASTSTFNTYSKMQYLIIFAHGLFSFGNAVGIDYFYAILSDLARNGADTWVTRVSTMDSSEIRGEQILQQVE